jgi:hypothetical protein
VGAKHRATLVPFYELLTAPASHILDRWFESDILKATLATDAVIGAEERMSAVVRSDLIAWTQITTPTLSHPTQAR